MAITFAELDRSVKGDRVHVYGEVTFDSSYPNTGGTVGEPIAAADVGLTALDYIVPEPVCGAAGAATRFARWHFVNQTLHLYTALSTEAANASDQSTIKCYITAIGY